MNEMTTLPCCEVDVAVIGAGPAGLAAATAASKAGLARVVLIEREAQAGGVPRHCGHSPFGMREFRRVLKGADYSARLAKMAEQSGVEIRLQTSVVEIRPGGDLLVTGTKGPARIKARRVILATGARETPRSARLIGGTRCGGVLNTGALQAMAYLKGRRPFKKPVILGSELVAFSALLTCRHAGMRPQAMIEPESRITARWPSGVLPRLMGVPLLTQTRLVEIRGTRQVEGVVLRGRDGAEREVACDGVVLTGAFVPESALARTGHLEVDPATGGPVVDQFGRCSDPVYFAAGNVLRAVETAGWCWNEGRRIGTCVVRDMKGELPDAGRRGRLVSTDARLKYVVPQFLSVGDAAPGLETIQFRVCSPVSGWLLASKNKHIFLRRRLQSRPERRLQIPLGSIEEGRRSGEVAFSVEVIGN